MVLKSFGSDIVKLVKNYNTLNVVTGEQISEMEDYISILNTLKDTNTLTTDSMNGLYKRVESLNSDSLTYYFQSVVEGAENARVNIVDAYAAILDGNTHGLKNVQSVMNTFNNSFNGNIEKQKEFTQAVGQSNKGLANYLNSIEKGGTATLKGYAGQLVKTTAKTVLLTAKTVALQAAISIGLSLAINGLISIITKAINKQKEMREEIDANAEASKENIKNISDLYLEYRKLSEEFITNKKVKDDLSSTTNSLLEALGYEKTQIDELTKGYQNLDDAINKATLDSLKKAADSLNLEVGEKFKDLQDMFDGVGIWNSDTFKFDNIGKQSFENMKMLKAVRDAQIESVQFFDETNSGNVMGINIDTSTIDGMKKAADTYSQIIDTIRYNSGLSAEELGLNTIFQELVTRYTSLDTAIENYSSALKDYNNNIAQQIVITSLIGKEIPKTQESFDQYKQDLIESITSNSDNQFIGTESDIENAINNILGLMPEFTEFTSNTSSNVNTTTNSIYNLVAASDDLKDSLDNTFSNQSTIQSAFDKIQEGTSLSADEVRKLIELCPKLASEFTKTADGYTIDSQKLIDANDSVVDSTKQSLQERADYLKEFINTDYDTDNIASDPKKYAEWQQSVSSAKTELEGLELVLSMFGIILDDTDDKLEESQKAYDELSKSVNSYVSNQKSITSALEEQEKYGQLSAKTIQELTDAGYAQALVVDSETGAVTLNKQAYEQLNKEKKQAIILEGEQQKSELATKLQEEKKAIEELGKEYADANEERKKAILLEMEEHGASYNDIQSRITNINKYITSLDAPDFGDGKETKPDSVLTFEKELARRQHEINMGRMSEDEDYYNWLDSAAKKAYEGLEDYQDDLWKYEEEAYKGRKKLAEDYYNNLITDLESQVDITLETSTSDDGTKLNTKEKFAYVKSIYQEILNLIEEQINNLIQEGVDGNSDAIKQLEKQYQEYAKKLENVFEDEIDAEIDYLNDLKDENDKYYNDKIDKIESEKSAMEERYDAEIDKIDETIDALQKENDERQLANDIEKARQELEKAGQRTRKVYGADGTVSYKQDKEAINDAKENLNDLLLKQVIENLKTDKENLEDKKEAEGKTYDEKIKSEEDTKTKKADVLDTLLEVLNDYKDPSNKESNSNVWETIGKDKENVKLKDNSINVKGSEIDTTAIEEGTDDIVTKLLKNMGAPNSTIQKYLKGELDSVLGSIMGINASKLINSQYGTDKWSRGIDDFKIANSKMENVTMNIGDIVVNKPVGNASDLAKELMMNLPNAFQNQMYTNLKK